MLFLLMGVFVECTAYAKNICIKMIKKGTKNNAERKKS